MFTQLTSNVSNCHCAQTDIRSTHVCAQVHVHVNIQVCLNVCRSANASLSVSKIKHNGREFMEFMLGLGIEEASALVWDSITFIEVEMLKLFIRKS